MISPQRKHPFSLRDAKDNHEVRAKSHIAKERKKWKVPCSVSRVARPGGKNKNAPWVFQRRFPRASRGDNDYYTTAIPRRLRDISGGPASLNRAFYDGSLRGPTGTPISFVADSSSSSVVVAEQQRQW